MAAPFPPNRTYDVILRDAPKGGVTLRRRGADGMARAWVISAAVVALGTPLFAALAGFAGMLAAAIAGIGLVVTGFGLTLRRSLEPYVVGLPREIAIDDAPPSSYREGGGVRLTVDGEPRDGEDAVAVLVFQRLLKQGPRPSALIVTTQRVVHVPFDRPAGQDDAAVDALALALRDALHLPEGAFARVPAPNDELGVGGLVAIVAMMAELTALVCVPLFAFGVEAKHLPTDAVVLRAAATGAGLVLLDVLLGLAMRLALRARAPRYVADVQATAAKATSR